MPWRRLPGLVIAVVDRRGPPQICPRRCIRKQVPRSAAFRRLQARCRRTLECYCCFPGSRTTALCPPPTNGSIFIAGSCRQEALRRKAEPQQRGKRWALALSLPVKAGPRLTDQQTVCNVLEHPSTQLLKAPSKSRTKKKNPHDNA